QQHAVRRTMRPDLEGIETYSRSPVLRKTEEAGPCAPTLRGLKQCRAGNTGRGSGSRTMRTDLEGIETMYGARAWRERRRRSVSADLEGIETDSGTPRLRVRHLAGPCAPTLRGLKRP